MLLKKAICAQTVKLGRCWRREVWLVQTQVFTAVISRLLQQPGGVLEISRLKTVRNKALGWGCSRLAPHCAHHHRQLLGWGGCMGWGSVLREWGWSTPRHLEWHRVLVFRHHSQPQSSDTRLGRWIQLGVKPPVCRCAGTGISVGAGCDVLTFLQSPGTAKCFSLLWAPLIWQVNCSGSNKCEGRAGQSLVVICLDLLLQPSFQRNQEAFKLKQGRFYCNMN